MVNPVATLGKYVVGTEIRIQWPDKLIAWGRQKLEVLNNSEYFWMAASFSLLCGIDWALKHALVRLIEG